LTSDPIDRARRAKLLKEEFLDGLFASQRNAYQSRLAEIAVTELDPKQREQKITSLSVALKILANVEQGMNAIIQDGELAHKQLLKAEKVEKMSAPQRRIFNLIP
jgi:hypothetical protein